MFFVKHGLVGTIARDLVKKYQLSQQAEPGKSESEYAIETWNLWLAFNEVPIRNEDSPEKIASLEVMKEMTINSLLDVFSLVLYIEADISSTAEPKLFRKALNVFNNEARSKGIDLQNECEGILRTLSISGQ